jgi:hypothetical protein
LRDSPGVSQHMDDADLIDPDVIDLVVQPCTRVGMMMEDISPVALDPSREGLEERVAVIVVATRNVATIAAAAEDLLG